MSATEEGVRHLFEVTFGVSPAVVASAPGRVNLIGEHTDYNGGDVLPIAIAQRTWIALGRATNGKSRAITDRDPVIRGFDPESPARQGGWWDYLVAVRQELARLGVATPAFEIAVTSDVPAEAGLSSSAALEVAAAAGLIALVGAELPIREVALIGNRAENHYIGVNSGVMDQFASALSKAGHALYLQCASLLADYVPINEAVLIFDTGVPRSLRSSAFNLRKEECDSALNILRRSYPELTNLAAATPQQVAAANLPEPLSRRARHVTEETRRVRAAVDALRRYGSIPGDLIAASHQSLRDLYECSSPELDWFANRISLCPGVRGARLTGAGWGGCAIALGDADALAEAGEIISREYEVTFSIRPRVWITYAGPGVIVVSSSEQNPKH